MEYIAIFDNATKFPLLFIMTGCSCFQVCKDVPKPGKIDKPVECLKTIDINAPTESKLKCYMLDIINYRKYTEQLSRALEAYK